VGACGSRATSALDSITRRDETLAVTHALSYPTRQHEQAHKLSPVTFGARAHGQFEAHTPSNEIRSQTRTRKIREARIRAQRLIAEDVSASRRERTTRRVEGRGAHEESCGSSEGRRTREGRRTSESGCASESRCGPGESSCGSGEDDRQGRRSAGESHRAGASAEARCSSGTTGARAGRRR
jgi:hypothetical protein